MKYMGKQIVRVKRCSWDVMFYDDLITGNGFIISEPAEIKIDKDRKKTLYGPHMKMNKHLLRDIVVSVENLRDNNLKVKHVQYVVRK